jgi:hypothetical protein
MDDFLDRDPGDASWGHHSLPDHNGIRLHYLRQRAGAPVLRLHAWPGFWHGGSGRHEREIFYIGGIFSNFGRFGSRWSQAWPRTV